MSRIISKLVSIFTSVIMVVYFFSARVYADDIEYYSGEFDIIAYSSVQNIDDAPINSAEHYIKCCSEEYPFTTIKGDLRLTADGGIVMCHDKGFTFNTDGKITTYNASNSVEIHNLTLDQCLGLQYEKKYNDEYVNVCDFETYIKICAEHDKNAFITIRNEYIPELVDVMMPIIYKYNMQTKCRINSFTFESLETVKKYDNSILLSWVINDRKLSYEIIDKAQELGNCIVSLFNFPMTSRGGFKELVDYEELINYAKEKNVEMYVAVIESISYVDDLRKYGISGAQVGSLKTVENSPDYCDDLFHGISLNIFKKVY